MIRSHYKHEQLAEILRREIHSGAFTEGRFHTVKTMMERFQVSQATLTRALQPLYEEGLIYSVSGKGTFVTRDVKTLSGAGAASPVIYCIAAYEEMFDPARTSPDWCFTQLMLQGIVSAARKRGMTVNIAPMATDLETFKSMADREGAMFIFLSHTTCEQLVEYVVGKQIPYSLYDNAPVGRELNTVCCDVEKATEDITEHLIARGHRKIAFLGDFADSPRHRGYRRALRRHGIPYRKEHSCFLYRGLPEPSREVTRELLLTHPEITAMAVTTDLRAAGAWNALKELPEKRELISLDNMWKYYNFSPPLTSMDMHLMAAGEALFEILLEKKEDGRNHRRTIQHTLFQGETA